MEIVHAKLERSAVVLSRLTVQGIPDDVMFYEYYKSR